MYAYNHGVAYVYDDHLRYVPATAIGGGSSFAVGCNDCTVNIRGGEVYAQSVGGVTIGGGGSGLRSAGSGTVNISGGTVTAKSISGTVTSSQMPSGMQTISVPAGNAIEPVTSVVLPVAWVRLTTLAEPMAATLS